MSKSVASVSQIVDQIKNTLEESFRSVIVEGEVSNLACAASGHWYFTLSDSGASISVALFARDAERNPVIGKIKDGDKVVCSGSIGVYSRRGTFQIITRIITPSGKGALALMFEQLKKRLAAEGLFDMEIKQQITPFPKRIGVVTSEGGAALQDFLNIYERRSHWMDILLAPALVQGEGSAASIRSAFNSLIKYSMGAPEEKKLDVIILTRGGGSLEDLWSFNDEALAWDIFNCPIPTISAVGHQVDFTIADYVADLRCETPSAAAEVLTQGQVNLRNRLNAISRRLFSHIDIRMSDYRRRLSNSSPRICVDVLWSWLGKRKQRLAQLNLSSRVTELTQINEKVFQLEESFIKLKLAPKNFFAKKLEIVEKNRHLLEVLGPANVLSRGYTYLKTSDRLISSLKKFKLLSSEDEINVVFHDGEGRGVFRAK